jgi:predicted alpha/beta-fold hydrolase
MRTEFDGEVKILELDRLPCPLSDFKPLPLLGNRHVQTLLGHLLRGPAVTAPTRRHTLWLPDGDGLVLHDTIPPNWPADGPIAVLVHGLTGSHASPGIQRLAVCLLECGARVVRFDQRGTGAGLLLARGFYHAGRSDDLRAVLELVHGWSSTSPLLLAGVSLGGNVVLKLAGEAEGRPVPGLKRVAVIAPPIDLERCSALLAHRRNRVYESHFVGELLAEANKRQSLFPDLPPLRFPKRVTVRIFDDLYTAPRAGFLDSTDYYSRCSAAPLIERIVLPTLIMTARDDPFIAVEPFEALTPPSNVTLRILPKGGHVGFLGRDGAGGIRWAERRLVEWLLQ